MTIQYAIVGGQLIMDKVVFTREIMMPDSPLKVLMKAEEGKDIKSPIITKLDRLVTINYNEASDILLDEKFYDLLKKLKGKYQEKVTGKVVIRISALTAYHVVLDLNSEDGRILYE